MMITNEIATLLGFAKKSSKLFTGESAVKNAVRSMNADLVILAEDLPEKRRTYWTKRCELAGIRTVVLGTKEEYGRILGSSERGILAVTDKKMSAAIFERIARASNVQHKLHGGD